jgi:hypothetical protein
VLKNAPGLEKLQVLSFSKVYYDKTDHTMKPKEKARKDDFISISGTKMRKLGAASVASFLAAVLTEIYLCNVCS